MSAIERRFDVLVVGSGAAGSIAVKELAERGLDVLLLEAGRDLTDADFVPPPPARPRALGPGLGPRLRAGLRGQPVQARRAFFSPAISPFLVDDRENPYSTPKEQFYLWIRGRILGGRLHSYGRVLLRMSDYDFKGASRDGHAVDWPISYSDLEPHYDRIEQFIGVYGNADGVPQLPDGTYCGPAKLNDVEREFKQKVEEHWPERRVVAWRYAAPNPHRVPRGIVAARETGRLTLRTDAVVKKITVDGRTGLADGAVFVDRVTKQEHRVSADVVVLCASTIESVRLLLNSASERHPHGLGNSSGLLGQYFMDQTPSLAFGTVPGRPGYWEADDTAPHDEFYSPAGGIYVPRSQNLDGQPAPFARGFAVQGAIARFPVPETAAPAFGMMAFGEMLPRPDNRITIDPKRRDAWGIPAPHISLSLSDNERAILREQVRAVREMTEYCGFRIDFIGSMLELDARNAFPDADPFSRYVFRRGFRKSLSLGAAIHESGGVRMGADPATSVLNGHNQSWDVPNLFVTDGSCFPSNGIVGPTLTIMALTARACEHIAREHTSGRGLRAGATI
jgi:choline dehydrogenase-like flavoprotein